MELIESLKPFQSGRILPPLVESLSLLFSFILESIVLSLSLLGNTVLVTATYACLNYEKDVDAQAGLGVALAYMLIFYTSLFAFQVPTTSASSTHFL